MSVTQPKSKFAVGSLVTARGREWVVLPDSDDELLVLRPLGGGKDDVAGVIPSLEQVAQATFSLPSPEDAGDDRSARLLREALRIGFRSSGGPFRSLAGLGVSPRPYQIVPLLIALRQDTVRLLIADDVGVGKTIEAGLVAAELLAQGSAARLAVLCPPSLAEQWRTELAEKFGMIAQLVLPGTVRQLQRGLAQDESVFDRFPITVVSTDFIKAENRRHDFLRAAPDLIIIDEAHGCASDDSGRSGSGRTQRYKLVQELAKDPTRHLVLVSATPHSGNDGAFRNLIGLLNPALRTVDLASESGRRLLAEHMIQRRRADIRDYLGQDTKFPKDRQTLEVAYLLNPSHRELFRDVLSFVRGQVQDKTGTKLEQRIRWWSALSLLRAMASSPAAAESTLGTRAANAEAETIRAADDLGSSEILDQVEDDGLGGADSTPGALTPEREQKPGQRRALREFQKRAAGLKDAPAEDAKLQLLTTQVKKLLKDGYHPIVFCRFIPTAHYVMNHLRSALKKVSVEVVTGELPSEDRAQRTRDLSERAAGGDKVLVATDCLSEGVNLQDDFQAVLHYDLAWNPTRHEQREGRVDRFGQPAPTVRALLIYGEDTGIDGIILDVLLRKHETIRRDLGISVPVPPQSDQVLAALLEGLLMRGKESDQLELDFDLGLDQETKALEAQWRSSAEAEKRSRSRFAQLTVRPDEVQSAVDAARLSLGQPSEVIEFVRTGLEELGAQPTANATGFSVGTAVLPRGLRDTLDLGSSDLTFALDYPAARGSSVLVRTDPKVTAIAQYVLNSALDSALPARERPARRCSIIATNAVSTNTFALLVRFRTHLVLPTTDGERVHLAEEAKVLAFTGRPNSPSWLSETETELLLRARPSANTAPDVARNILTAILNGIPDLEPHLAYKAQEVAEGLREDHVAVRRAARGDRAGSLRVRGLTVTPQLPVDILGVYIYRPDGGRS